jgi:glutaredoxin
MKALLSQECPLAFLYLTWALFLAGLIYFPVRGEWVLAGAWLVVFPLALWGYVRVFPSISRLLGYGRVDDEAASNPSRSSRTVTMYSSVGCPFCPIVEERLHALQEELGFEFRHVDVTLKPALVRAKKIRSVPVVEVGDHRLVGHATTQQLATLIAGEAEAATPGTSIR